MKNILTVDIGNTNITFAVVRGRRVLRRFSLPNRGLSVQLVRRTVKQKADSVRPRVSAVYACSVAASTNRVVRRALREALGVPIYFTGEDVKVPIRNLYRKPGQVGQDRLVGAYAASKLYGPGLVVVDFGTAITFDIVSRRGEYVGGLIVPGFKIMQEALERRTALLPYVELARPVELIGRDTKSSIRAGLVYGAAGLCDGILARLLKGKRKGWRVIATGGDARLVRPHSKYLRRIDEDLIHKGLAFVARSRELQKSS